MKNIAPLGLLATTLIVAGAACSDDEGTDRPATMPVAGSGMTAAGNGGGGAGGTGMTSNGGTGMMASTTNYSAALVIDDTTASGPVGGVTIAGNIFAATNGEKEVGVEGTDESSWIETFTATDNEICMKGRIKEVPDAGSYGTHWGVQAGLNLNVPARAAIAAPTPAVDADAGVAGDAGVAAEVDAGGLATGGDATDTPQAWDAGEVRGFSFKVTGTLPSAMRFLGTPSDPDLSGDPTITAADLNYCSNVALFADEDIDVLFTDIADQCWEAGIDRAPFAPPLISVAWQIPSDIGAANNYDYDFCITDIRAILP